MNLKKYFVTLFPKSNILFTNGGRAALQAIVEDFKLQNSKMILPSYICSSVFSTLLVQNNIQPILVDCPKNEFNISFLDIKKSIKIEKNVKSLVLVHSYGLINKDAEKISKFCQENDIVLIEDCAHCIGIQKNGKYAGTFGDASIFSFPKTLNLPFGGAYVKNNGRIRIKSKGYRLNSVDTLGIVKKIPLTSKIIKFLKFLGTKKIVNPSEISKIEILPLPRFINSFSKNQVDFNRRKEVTEYFYKNLKEKILQNLSKLEFENNFFHSIPILVENRDEIFLKLLENKIPCDRMWTDPLHLNKKVISKWKTRKCPNAEFFSKKIINILINPKWEKEQIEKQVETIFKIVNSLHNPQSLSL